MATTRAPSCLAILATTGAEPVPVPPPMPARTNTRSAPRKRSSMSVLALSAAFLPTSGSPPAPIPRVSFRPISIFSSAETVSRCWRSVFMAMVFAPIRPILLSLLMVFPPAPPQPTISILGIPKSSPEFEKSMASRISSSIPIPSLLSHNQLVPSVNNNCG
ncbi:MAG: hypothetical protein A4E43_01234 [Methanosaeta sp. PtaB.Bin005]|nr:MAG: hypothetical protein A4E43_01234 [Methanosaeta sp. PtaB.Bin005]